MNKQCARCGKTKDVSEFTHSYQSKDGLRSYCRECTNKYQAAWVQKNLEQVKVGNRKSTNSWRQKNKEKSRQLIKDWYKRNPNAKKRYWVKRYGMSWDEFQEKLKSQNHKCKVCGKTILERTEQHIDHDHACCSEVSRSCGKCVRGVLCRRCNHVLGQVNDDIVILRSMSAYLKGSVNWDTAIKITNN